MVSVLVSIHKVNLPQARLVLGSVTMSGVPLPVPENLSQYITIHPGQLSLAILLWVGAMRTRQRAVMLCGWGVKAGMVRECVAWYQGPYVSALSMSSSHNRALYKCPIACFALLLLCFIHCSVYCMYKAYICCVETCSKLLTPSHIYTHIRNNPLRKLTFFRNSGRLFGLVFC